MVKAGCKRLVEKDVPEGLKRSKSERWKKRIKYNR